VHRSSQYWGIGTIVAPPGPEPEPAGLAGVERAPRAGDLISSAMASTPGPLPRVGFVGVGQQGAPIAQRIIAAGYPTSLWAR
jgi:hypothetical protein